MRPYSQHKNVFAFLLLLFFSSYIFAQVGIGTTDPNGSSALEIYNENAGLLIPRVTLTSATDVTTIPSPADYLMVFNTATTATITPGLVYWKDGSWLRVLNTSDSSSSGSGWALTGNSISGTEFLGTTNYTQLNFKANSVTMAQFHPNGSVALGRSAVISSSYHSFAIGEQADASGEQNAYAFGTTAKASGSKSMALGTSAIASNTESYAFGSSSTASGYRSVVAGVSSTASNNNAVAIGNQNVVSGLNSMALGYDSQVTGDNAVALGYQAVANNPNTIILGNTSSNAWYRTKVGIGTTNPSASLDLEGTLQYVDGNESDGYVLVSDANGNASWSDVNDLEISSAVFGEIYSSSASAQNFSWSGSAQTLTFGSDNYENSVSASTSTLTTSVTGLYRVTFTISIEKGTGNSIDLKMYLATNGNASNIVPASSAYVSLDSNSDIVTITINKFVQLNSSDSIAVFWEKVGGNSSNFSLLPEGSSFNIELLNYNF
ncbi:hypothetical protein NBRC110019_26800 [Neptunitalea chrysea]|uniref:Trimeric autotransporter adhesin YadA-like head domain-containing protein n=1 Tax=Neptunitalea chrysea TaxID=1647581 RepID=A0A9W6B8U3_9FLAO|nr:hypothetical protein [Neptunitalea chrysea]GLB53639.1 hypothetical protein NBRC110019_26800 [Neptunitalea chrysea]